MRRQEEATARRRAQACKSQKKYRQSMKQREADQMQRCQDLKEMNLNLGVYLALAARIATAYFDA